MQYILNWDCGLILPRSVVETNSFFVASASDMRTWHTGTYLLEILHQSVSLVKNACPWSTSWFTVQNTLILEIHVLMLTQWENCLIQFLLTCVNYVIHTKSWPLIFNLIVLNYLVIHIFSSHYHIHVFDYCIILVLKCTSHQFSIFIVIVSHYIH